MATITSTTSTVPLRYPGTTFIDYQIHLPPNGAATGYLYALIISSTANTYEIWRTTNGGASWALFSSVVRASVAEVGPIHIDANGWLHWVFRTNESSQDRIYYQRMDAVGAWCAEVLLTNNANGGVAGAIWTGMDFMFVNYGSGGGYQAGVVAVGTNSGGNIGVSLFGITAAPGFNPISNNGAMAGSRQFCPIVGTGRVGPSIDMEHTGNAKGSAVPNFWVVFGRTTVQALKLAWNGHGWITPTASVEISSTIGARDYFPGRWDGGRFMMVRTSGTQCLMYERNKANTSTIGRLTPAHPDGTTRAVTLGYNSSSGNPRVFAVGTSTNDLYYVDYDRALGSWGSWINVTTVDILGAGVDNFSVRRGTSYTSKYDVLTASAVGPPFPINHTAVSPTFSPLTPTWVFTTVPYTNGGAADTAASLLLDWTFNHTDPTAVQNSYALSRQVGALALEYWRASDSTWQVAEVQNTSATTSLTLTSTQWSVDGLATGPTDPNYTFKVKTWDATPSASSYSSALVIVPSIKVNPSITFPVTSSTVATDHVTVTWTVAEQSAYQVQLLIFGVVLHDTGKVISSSAVSYAIPTALADQFNYSIKVWTWNNEGLQSTAAQSDISVRYVGPMTPTLVVSPDPVHGYMKVAVSNPGSTTFVNAGAVATGNNTTLNPALPSGLAAGDLLLVLSMIENSGTGTPNLPTGTGTYTALATFGNVGLYGRIVVAGEAAPSASYAGGVAGAATSAQTAAFRNAALATIGTPATQLNGVTANIAYPALTVATKNCIVLVIGWKQDGTGTSVGTLAGMAELGDNVNVNGHLFAWDYVIQTTATNVSSASMTVTGGVTAISRAIVVAISGVPDVLGNDIYRNETASIVGDGTRVGADIDANTTLNDWRALDGVDYSYQAWSLGDNGTSTKSVWTA